ncbi:unnamed protein product, partial [Laminaria digitata]
MARTRRRSALRMAVFTLCVQRALTWMPQVPTRTSVCYSSRAARQHESAAAVAAAATAVPARAGNRKRGGEMRLSLSSPAFVRGHRVHAARATATWRKKDQRPEHQPILIAAAARAAAPAAAAATAAAAAAGAAAVPVDGVQPTGEAITTSQHKGDAT